VTQASFHGHEKSSLPGANRNCIKKKQPLTQLFTRQGLLHGLFNIDHQWLPLFLRIRTAPPAAPLHVHRTHSCQIKSFCLVCSNGTLESILSVISIYHGGSEKAIRILPQPAGSFLDIREIFFCGHEKALCFQFSTAILELLRAKTVCFVRRFFFTKFSRRSAQRETRRDF